MSNGSNGKQGALIFLHIPKSAGTTLNFIIVWEYSPWKICSVDGRFPRWAFRRISHWRPRRLARSDVFTGHMPFGLHRFLGRETSYITVLRDPVERVISEYHYRMERKSHPLADMKIKGLSLQQYIEDLPYDNVQTKLLAGGSKQYDFMAGACNDEMLEIAKHNLANHFSLVGLTERFEETLGLAKLLLGWKIEHYATLRVTRGRPVQKRLSPEMRELIAERNRFDIALYNYGLALFEETVERNRDRLLPLLDEVRKARLPEGPESTRYRMTTLARRWIIRVRSDL